VLSLYTATNPTRSELDEHHRSPTSFETDRERDVTLTAAGWRVLRFTWTQITRRRFRRSW
jgi:very-short-patch-repair endonuclease